MMAGTIANKCAHLNCSIRGAGGQGKVEFTIDTGCTALLTLPRFEVTEGRIVGLRWQWYNPISAIGV